MNEHRIIYQGKKNKNSIRECMGAGYWADIETGKVSNLLITSMNKWGKRISYETAVTIINDYELKSNKARKTACEMQIKDSKKLMEEGKKIYAKYKKSL